MNINPYQLILECKFNHLIAEIRKNKLQNGFFIHFF